MIADLASTAARVRDELLRLAAGDDADELHALALEVDDALPVELACPRCSRHVVVRSGDLRDVDVDVTGGIDARLKGNGLPCPFCVATRDGTVFLAAVTADNAHNDLPLKGGA